MEGKRKRGGGNGNDSSSSDDSSVHHHLHHHAFGEPSRQNEPDAYYYSAHIASVCEALNTEAERSTSPFEKMLLKKRRETNQLSANNWCRRRQRDEIKLLEEQIQMLRLETEQLEAEKVRLQAEFQRELAMGSWSRANAGDDRQKHSVPQASQAYDATIMLRWLLQQHGCTQHFIPSNLAHMGPSFSAFSGFAPTSAGLDVAAIVQNAARSGQGFAPSPTPSPAALPLDLLNHLSMLQTSQGSSASSMASNLTPLVMPQSLAAASSTDPASRLAVAAWLPALLQSIRHETENSRSIGPISTHEYSSLNNPAAYESKRKDGKGKQS
jgi:hypothetical protein